MPLRNKKAQAQYLREHYLANKGSYHARNRTWKAKQRGVLRKLVVEAKDVPCADCGQQYPPWVMQFDHRPGTKKLGDVASMVGLAVSVEKLEAEIKKCDVTCANCHADRTYKRNLGQVDGSRVGLAS